MRRARAVLLGALALAVGACGGTRTPVDGGLAQAYRDGVPAFSLDAIASVRDDRSGIDVYLGAPPSSVVFRQGRGGQQEAVAVWAVSVEQEGRPPIAVEHVDTLRVPAERPMHEAPSIAWTRRVDVPPGAYRVRAMLEDGVSGRSASRLDEVVVLTPDAEPSLGELRFESAGKGSPTPVLPLDVPAGLASLQVVTQATAVPAGAETVVTVERVRADSVAAAPLSAFTPSYGSLAAAGIDPASADTLLTVRQSADASGDHVDLVAPIPALQPGVYRVSVSLTGEPPLVRSRLVIVRRPDYPLVTRQGDLIDPLVYLASPGEWDRLRQARGPFQQRRAFDAFWGEQIDDRRVAAATVRAYYERVEEANRLYATHKPGWKTDRGLVYVLFGPPAFVESSPRGETWTYGARVPVFAFTYTAGRPGDALAVLTLQRQREYDDALRRVRRLWRTGTPP